MGSKSPPPPPRSRMTPRPFVGSEQNWCQNTGCPHNTDYGAPTLPKVLNPKRQKSWLRVCQISSLDFCCSFLDNRHRNSITFQQDAYNCTNCHRNHHRLFARKTVHEQCNEVRADEQDSCKGHSLAEVTAAEVTEIQVSYIIKCTLYTVHTSEMCTTWYCVQSTISDRSMLRIKVLKELHDEKFTLDGREFQIVIPRSVKWVWRTFRL